MATPFSQSNMDFSLRAREVAVENVYPKAFGDGSVQDMTGTKLDSAKGYDLIWVNEDGETFSIQERFRREKYSHFREVTATKKNVGTGRDGDWMKIEADYYAYGYFDGESFSEIIIVDVQQLKDGNIEPNEQWYGQKKQRFLCWPIERIITEGYHVFHRK